MTSTEKFKKNKMEEKILLTMNQLLRTHFSDHRLQFVSFTKVILSCRYSHAKIYWDTFDGEKKQEASKAIAGIHGKMRSHLANLLQIRQIPQLKFIYDSQFESEKNISDILKNEAHLGRE